jgi:NAD(P)-dependent dehydrogenase (short-subunit alcohol dehydrogenase family)
VTSRVVAITGGARGIGAATAAAFVADGARVAIGDLDPGPTAPGVAAYPLDVTDPASFAVFVAAVERDLGPLDVLVNNAGVLIAGPVADETDDVTRRILDVNLRGTITGTKLALRSMLPRRTGHVINVASLSGETYGGGEATYCSSKYGVVGFTDAARFELHGRGVRFTLVMPGLVDTRLTAGSGRLLFVNQRVSPHDVAAAIVAAAHRPRRRVYVPAGLGVAVRLRRLVPQSLSDTAAGLIGARTMFIDVEPGVRDEYERQLKR